MPIGLSGLMLSKMIFTIAVSGTERNIPTIPLIEPQKISENMISSGLRSMPFPIMLGSTRLPIVNFTVRIAMPSQRALIGFSNCTRAKRNGSTLATIEPMLGMKLRKNVRIPQMMTKSSPNIQVMSITMAAARKPTSVLTTMYFWMLYLIPAVIVGSLPDSDGLKACCSFFGHVPPEQEQEEKDENRTRFEGESPRPAIFSSSVTVTPSEFAMRGRRQYSTRP